MAFQLQWTQLYRSTRGLPVTVNPAVPVNTWPFSYSEHSCAGQHVAFQLQWTQLYRSTRGLPVTVNPAVPVNTWPSSYSEPCCTGQHVDFQLQWTQVYCLTLGLSIKIIYIITAVCWLSVLLLLTKEHIPPSPIACKVQSLNFRISQAIITSK